MNQSKFMLLLKCIWKCNLQNIAYFVPILIGWHVWQVNTLGKVHLGRCWLTDLIWWRQNSYIMMSSNGNIFRVTDPLCGSFTGHRFPAQRPVTRRFDVFFDLRLNERLSKQSWGWWFETPSRRWWRHCNELCWLSQFVFALNIHGIVSVSGHLLTSIENTVPLIGRSQNRHIRTTGVLILVRY